MRKCEFCGCETNAKLRMCCSMGYYSDGGKNYKNSIVSKWNGKPKSALEKAYDILLGEENNL